MKLLPTTILGACVLAFISDAAAEVYTINGKISSTFPNFFRDNTVQVGCNSEGCSQRVTVAADGTYTLVRDTGSLGVGETFLTYYVTSKLASAVVPYDVECNPDGSVQTIRHGTLSGTFTAPEFVFRNLDVQASKVSVSGKAKPGGKIRVKARTDNVGDQTIYEDFTVGVYLLNKPSFAKSSSWKRVGGYSVTGPFEPDYYDEQTVTVTIPKSVKAGSYYIGIIADDDTDLTECYLNTKFDPSMPSDNDYLVSSKPVKVKR